MISECNHVAMYHVAWLLSKQFSIVATQRESGVIKKHLSLSELMLFGPLPQLGSSPLGQQCVIKKKKKSVHATSEGKRRAKLTLHDDV